MAKAKLIQNWWPDTSFESHMWVQGPKDPSHFSLHSNAISRELDQSGAVMT